MRPVTTKFLFAVSMHIIHDHTYTHVCIHLLFINCIGIMFSSLFYLVDRNPFSSKTSCFCIFRCQEVIFFIININYNTGQGFMQDQIIASHNFDGHVDVNSSQILNVFFT